jgi:hypothetical protein
VWEPFVEEVVFHETLYGLEVTGEPSGLLSR